MQLSIDLWQAIVFFAGLAATLISAFYAMQNRLAEVQRETSKTQYDGLSKQLSSLLEVTKGQGEDVRRIERDFMAMKAELPRDYVRREDYLQAIATIHTKLDNIALRMEMALNRASKQGSNQE